MSIEDFAQKIKAKYPGSYDDMDNHELANRVLAKYPVYRTQVDLRSGGEMDKLQVQGKQPSFGDRLTAGYDPGAAEFDEQHPILGKGVRALSSMGGTILGMPKGIYHAFADEPTPEEIAKYGADEVKGAKRIGLGFDRMVTDPIENAAHEYSSGKISPKGAMSVLPEAIGTGAGSYVGSDLPLRGAGAFRPIIAKSLKNTSYGIYNNVLGTKGSGLAFEGNPGRGVAQEGIVAGSRPSLLNKIDTARGTRGAQIDQVLDLPQHSALSLDVSEPVSAPFKSAITKGTRGALSDATLKRLSQTQRELTEERAAPGEYTGQPKNLSRLNPREANNVKRDIQGRTNYFNPENDELVNNTLRQSAYGVKEAVNKAVPDVVPFNRRVQDLEGAHDALSGTINRRMVNPSQGWRDTAPAIVGNAIGGGPGSAALVAGRRMIGSTPFKTAAAQAAYRLGNIFDRDAPLRVPDAQAPDFNFRATPLALPRGPIPMGSSMEPIEGEVMPPPKIARTTRAQRMGLLLPERASMSRPIEMGSQMEPIEDVGPMSQDANSVVQRNPRSGKMQRVYQTSSKRPKPIRVPD